MISFDKVEQALDKATGIAWDECHKIYVLLDDEQLNQMRVYEYEQVISADEMSKEDLLKTLKNWYDDSCALRFIQSVETNYEDPNLGFDSLIDQFADMEEEEEK